MRTISLAIVALMASVTGAQAQRVSGYVESWNTVGKSGITPQINMFVYGPLKGKLGWSAFSLTSQSYSQAYGGLTYAPTKWLEVGGNIGLETADDPTRGAATLWLGKGKWSFLSIHETGGSGWWHRDIGKYQLTETFAVGLVSQRFRGNGPYFEKKFGRIVLWMNVLTNKEGTKAQATVRLNL
ncbi:MAG: hypothetical protein WED06_03280 [Candidatus Paceibacterota bacterium]